MPLVDLEPRHRRRLDLLGLAVVVLVALSVSDPAHALLDRLLTLAEEAVRRHPAEGGIFFVLFAAVSAMLAFFSSAVLVPVAVKAWGEPLTGLLLWLGWFLGGASSYVVGRYFGGPLLERLLPAEEVEKYTGKIRRRSKFHVILLFQTALPSEIPGYVLGIVACPLPRYLAALALAELPFVIGAVYLGKSFLDRDYVMMGAVGAAGIVLVFGALQLWQRRPSRDRSRENGRAR